jgi:hypothetical protein
MIYKNIFTRDIEVNLHMVELAAVPMPMGRRHDHAARRDSAKEALELLCMAPNVVINKV